MPYARVTELPDSVRNVLPAHAQQIYKEAFNSAWDQYAKPSERQGDDTREETAHQVAWGAVKRGYEKGKSGNWVKKRD